MKDTLDIHDSIKRVLELMKGDKEFNDLKLDAIKDYNHDVVLRLVRILHDMYLRTIDEKGRGYGPSWQLRGEYKGISGNVDRKYDRYETVLKNKYEGGKVDTSEDFHDTLMDLSNYSVMHDAFRIIKFMEEHMPIELEQLEDFSGVPDFSKVFNSWNGESTDHPQYAGTALLGESKNIDPTTRKKSKKVLNRLLKQDSWLRCKHCGEQITAALLVGFQSDNCNNAIEDFIEISTVVTNFMEDHRICGKGVRYVDEG